MKDIRPIDLATPASLDALLKEHQEARIAPRDVTIADYAGLLAKAKENLRGSLEARFAQLVRARAWEWVQPADPNFACSRSEASAAARRTQMPLGTVYRARDLSDVEAVDPEVARAMREAPQGTLEWFTAQQCLAAFRAGVPQPDLFPAPKTERGRKVADQWRKMIAERRAPTEADLKLLVREPGQEG